MAKKRETVDNKEILDTLQKFGWFRNISDKYQVGIPDNIGCYRGLMFGFEVKSVGEVPLNGLVPSSKEHRFSPPQVHELTRLQNKGGGIGLGLIMCGNVLFWFTPEYINCDGQVDCNKLLEENKFITKHKDFGWDYLGSVLQLLWGVRMQDILSKIAEITKNAVNAGAKA